MRKLACLIIVFMFISNAWATKSKLVSAKLITPNTTGARYFNVSGGNGTGGLIAERSVPFPTGGTLGNLHVVSSDPTTASSSYTYTLYVNGSPTSIACIIAAGATSCNYTASTAAVTAGQLIVMRTDPTNGGGGAPAAVTATWNLEFDSTTDSETALLLASTGNATADYYAALMGESAPASAEAARAFVMPTAGDIKSLYVLWTAAPGGADGENIRTVTLYKNGSPQTLTCALDEAATTCNDTAHTVAAVAGDLLSYKLTVSGTVATPAAAAVHIGSVFATTVEGEFIIPYNTSITTWNTGAASYGAFVASGLATNATEALTYGLGWSDWSIKGSACSIVTAPGSGDTWTFNIRKDSGDVASGSDYDCVISDAATSAVSTDTTPLTLVDSSMYNTVGTPSGTPTAPGYGRMSYIGYIAPAGAPGTASNGLLLRGVGQ